MHRWIHEDGGRACFACGTFVDEGAQDEAGDMVPCRPGGHEHPPYVLGVWDGEVMVETCAAHPYSDCEPLAMATARGEDMR